MKKSELEKFLKDEFNDVSTSYEPPGSSANNQQDGPQATNASSSTEKTEAGEAAEKKSEEKESSEEETPSDSKGSEMPYPSTLFLITAHDELGK